MSDDVKKEALKDRLRSLIREAASQHRVRKAPSARGARRMRIEVENVSRDRVVIVIDRDSVEE